MNDSDNAPATAAFSTPVRDLGISSEPFEITAELVATNLDFGGGHLPDEMMSTVERIWLDTDFTWPTTLAVTRIMLSVEPSPDTEPPQEVWSRVSILGTGWASDRPVSLTWNNAFGFPGASIALPAAQPNQNGFIVTVERPGGLADSCSQPNRIIAMLAPAMPMSAEIDTMPV